MTQERMKGSVHASPSAGSQASTASPEAAASAPLKPSEALEKAAALIEPEGAWTQEAFWRDSNGNADSDAADATCWCASGAIRHVGPGLAEEARAYLRRAIRGANIFGWNDFDASGQAEVVAKLREAAELARSEGQ